jgi:hypothetical protein
MKGKKIKQKLKNKVALFQFGSVNALYAIRLHTQIS